MHTDERSMRASATARFVLIVDLPMPPLAPKTVTIVPAVAAAGSWPSWRSFCFSSASSAVSADMPQRLRLDRLREEVARARHHRLADRLDLLRVGVDDDRRLRQQALQRLDRLQRALHRLADADEDDVRAQLVRRRHRLHAEAALAGDRQAGGLARPASPRSAPGCPYLRSAPMVSSPRFPQFLVSSAGTARRRRRLAPARRRARRLLTAAPSILLQVVGVRRLAGRRPARAATGRSSTPGRPAPAWPRRPATRASVTVFAFGVASVLSGRVARSPPPLSVSIGLPSLSNRATGFCASCATDSTSTSCSSVKDAGMSWSCVAVRRIFALPMTITSTWSPATISPPTLVFSSTSTDTARLPSGTTSRERLVLLQSARASRPRAARPSPAGSERSARRGRTCP